MNSGYQCRPGQTGGILPLVLVVLVAFSLLVVALLQLGWNSAREAEEQFNNVQAYWLAEAGLEQFKSILTVKENRVPIPSGDACRLSNNIPNIGNYSVVAGPDPSWDNAMRVIKKYIITSTGRSRNGTVQSIAIKASIKTFGDYLWSTHTEGNINFWTGDRIYGEVYTDDRLNINGTPVFYDLVQSAANSVHYVSGGSSAAFQGGLTLGVPQLDWVGVQAQVVALASDPLAQTFTGDYDVTFADTKAILRKRPSGPVTTNTITAGRIFYVTGDAYVKGTVGTRVSVATPKSIYITGNLMYKSAASKSADPEAWAGWVPASNEALGLYAKTQVQIGTGLGTVNIHAAILVPAGTQGFNADDWNQSHSGTWVINFYGSIGQYTRGAVGQVNGSGYLKNYHYDSRFRETPPPGIPYSVFYFSEWQQL